MVSIAEPHEDGPPGREGRTAPAAASLHPTSVARSRRHDRRLLVSEGLFSGISTSAHQTFFVTLLVQLGVSAFALGIYSALNGLLTNVTGLAGGLIQRRVPNRRRVAAYTGGLGRLGFLLIAVLLIVQHGESDITTLILISLVSAALIGVSIPMVTGIIGDAVPQRQRGAFFGDRLLASGIGAATIGIGVAALLRSLAYPNGFVIAYLLAGIAGVASALSLLQLRRVRNRTVMASAGSPTRSPLRSVPGVLWRYSLSTLILWTGAGMVGPVLVPYLLDDLGAKPSFIGLMTAVNSVTAILVQRFWGRRVDRTGSFSVVAVSTLIVASLPVLYGITPIYWFGLAFEIVSGIGWAGYALGNLNYALEVAPPSERTQYTAIVNAAAGIGSFIGPLLSIVMLAAMGPRLVLILAGVIRLAAFFMVQFARPGHAADMRSVDPISESA